MLAKRTEDKQVLRTILKKCLMEYVRVKNKRISKGAAGTYLLLIIVAVVFAYIVSQTLSQKSLPDSDISSTAARCCDTGSGDACQPQTGAGQKITYKGQEYGLLRTSTVLLEGNVHLKDSGETVNGNPIILNSSDTHIIPPQYATATCKTEAKDKYIKSVPPAPIKIGSPESVPYCVSIPDDEIIYVCKKNCHSATCSPIWGPEVTCYGDADSQYDAYFRMSDLPNGIPDFVKNCDTSGLSSAQKNSGGKQRIVTPAEEPGKKNLQLQTFKLEGENSLVPWLSPFCKPAVYLYPEMTMPIHVKIDPVGPIKLTIPQYPSTGWSVIANPHGDIFSQNNRYDYLYYEAEIPDEKIEKPTDGYVVTKNTMKEKLEELLPKLGLNKKEKDQFVEYWIKVLPSAPYYFIGIIPVSNLDAISPLSITPRPTTSIRVTLYFEPLDTHKDVTPPQLNSVIRRGFTMVEWGGIFKKSKDYPFSCFN